MTLAGTESARRKVTACSDLQKSQCGKYPREWMPLFMLAGVCLLERGL
jgi:hypothetical protein